jgi:bile acid:Na+ symporter, BASS family
MAAAKILAIVMLVSLTFGAGLQVDREHLKGMLAHVGLLLRALLANVIIVPLIGVIVASALRLNPFVATGILLMAISPGVPFILSGIRKKGGSLGLAVALAFLLPLVSIVTVPLTAELVLPVQAAAELPMRQFVMTLVLFQFIPLLAGIAFTAIVRRHIPKLERGLNVVFIAAVVALLIVLAPRIGHALALVFGSFAIIAVVCIISLSAATGWLLGGPEIDERRVLSIATMLRNIGLVSSIATSSFREPEIVAAALTYFVIQIIASVSIGAYFTRTARRAVA